MNNKRIISIIIAFLLIFSSSIILAFYSQWSYKIYNYPRCKDGIIEFEDDKSVTKNIMLHPLGEVEFYYNRWIVTDNDTDSYDSIINIPSKWSDALNNDIVHPKKGYGSYKLTLKNLTPGSNLLIDPGTTTVASNYYFNNEWVGYIGQPSKNKENNITNLKDSDAISYVVPESGIVEFVIECGYNDDGGLHTIPPIEFDNYDAAYMNFVSYCFGISFGVIIFTIIIGIIFSANKNRKFLLLPVLILMLIHYSFSYDSLILLRKLGIILDYTVSYYSTFITSSLLILVLINYLRQIKYIKLELKHMIPIAIVILILIISYPFTMYTGYNLIHTIVLGIFGMLSIIVMIKHLITDKNINLELFIFFTILGIILTQAIDYLEIIKVSSYGFVSVSIIVASIISLCIYIREIINLYKSEKLKNELEIKNLKYRQELLLKQIKPHFIYNSLTSLMALYHKDIDEGDRGIITFSKYLRANVDSIDSGLVPFNDEIDNIINYVELENLSLENKFNLLLNIKYEEFVVPLLSLQPIVENSIKYSGVNEKEDGYIKVSSELIDDIIVITISNNGIPFDTNNILDKSKGLSNIRDRFKLLLNAEVDIISNELETKTIIKFKLEDNYEGPSS